MENNRSAKDPLTHGKIFTLIHKMIQHKAKLLLCSELEH
jgi:hypothetical protein